MKILDIRRKKFTSYNEGRIFLHDFFEKKKDEMKVGDFISFFTKRVITVKYIFRVENDETGMKELCYYKQEWLGYD